MFKRLDNLTTGDGIVREASKVISFLTCVHLPSFFHRMFELKRNTDDLETLLIDEAKRRFGKIRLCSHCTLEKSFTFFNNKKIFWFNDEHNSTRFVCASLKTNKIVSIMEEG